ncbi:MAG: hypothetical protein ACOC2Y_06460 [Spirochaetota bacterium]
MFGPRKFHYLVDGLTDQRAALIRRSLSVIPEIRSVQISVGRSTIEVEATRDVADQVRLAADVAGAHYRTRARI